jgi:hypothetical protein
MGVDILHGVGTAPGLIDYIFPAAKNN